MKTMRPLVLAAIAMALPLAALAEDAKPAVTLTPYGILHFGAYWTGGSLVAQDYPGQAVLTGPGVRVNPISNGSFIESARASRIGLRGTIDDGNWTGASLAGLLEFDFNGGQFPGTQTATCTTASPPVCTLNSPAAATASTSWYNALVRLRFASLTATWKTPVGSVSILAGQDWSVFNGIHPESLAYYATPLFHNSGNAWRRGPQIRASYAGTFDKLALNVAVDAITPVSTAPVDNGSGNQARRPDLEGRIGLIVKPMADVSVSVAGSFSSGARRFNYTATPSSTSTQKDVAVSAIGAELDASLTGYLQLKGEYYAGKGMDDAFASIAPAGVGGTTGTAPLYVAERGTGFWGQAILKPMPQVWLTGGMGEARVNKDDLAKLAAAGTTRSKNQMVTGGVLFNAGKNWRFGVEYTQDTSTYGDFGSGATARAKWERKAQQIGLSSWCRF